jgi:mannosyltransferase
MLLVKMESILPTTLSHWRRWLSTEMSELLTSRKHLIRRIGGVVLIILIAYALRLHDLSGDSLWGDEIFTATQSPLPVGELLRWTAGDIHPPGYYLLVGRLADGLGWAHLSPSALTDWLWRFPSVLAGVLAVAVTYRLGADLLSRQVGLVSALLLAVSPVAIQYSQEARMHELFLLGVTLSTWALARALVRPGQWRWWLIYALATAFSLYMVYLAFIVLASQAVWVVVSRPRPATPLAPDAGRGSGSGSRAGQPLAVSRQFTVLGYPLTANSYRLLGWLLSIALAFTLYLPWWPTLLGIVSQRLAASGAEAGVGSPLVFLVKAIHSLGPGSGWVTWVFLGLWGIGLLSTARRKPSLALFGGLWLLLPLALPFVFRDPRALHVRYAFLLPVYLLFVAQGALVLMVEGWGLVTGGIGQTRNQKLVVSLIPCVLFFVTLLGVGIISGVFLPEYFQRTKPDWRGAGAYLTERTRPGDVVITGPLFDVGRYLDYYYDGPAELMPPALLVASLTDRVDSMRFSGGRVWAVTRFQPAAMAAVRNVQFPGLTILEPVVPVYEPDLLEAAMIDLMKQAVTAAPGWAANMSAEGVMNPDPLVARAAAYLFLGDVYRAAGRLPEAVVAYEAMVADHPASAAGYATLAEAYEAAGQAEAAATAYSRAVALNPRWQGPDAERAEALADAGHWDEAVAAYQAIVR